MKNISKTIREKIAFLDALESILYIVNSNIDSYASDPDDEYSQNKVKAYEYLKKELEKLI